MFQDLSFARRAKADPRPASAVSTGVGMAGLVGFAVWLTIARVFGMDGPFAGLANLLAIGVPMIGWSLIVDKVHRNVSTGIDWSHNAPLAETLDISLTKLAGLWATWGLIAAFYAVGRWYWQGNYEFAMWCFGWAAPVIFVASIPYVIWIDRKLIAPCDGAWALGAWLIGQGRDEEREAIFNHLRSWAVKGFFLAFMLSIVPGGFADLVRWNVTAALADPGALARFLISMMFVIDVAFATVGYMLTMRPLDAHIRTANPYAAAWMAALICYPPFILMGPGGPLDYHVAAAEWTWWFAGSPRWLAPWGVVLVALTAIYAWATVAFGLRFSNLTHRGILTHGPFAWTKHPAYWSKNAFWWIAGLPLLTTNGSWVDAVRNTAIIAVVSGVYYWRAKTEERHLNADPAYRAYSEWIARNGLWARLKR